MSLRYVSPEERKAEKEAQEAWAKIAKCKDPFGMYNIICPEDRNKAVVEKGSFVKNNRPLIALIAIVGIYLGYKRFIKKE